MPLDPDYYSRVGEPARRAAVVTAGATDINCRGVHVGSTGGTLTVVFADDDTATPITMDVAANTTYPWALRRVTAISGATNVRALF
jgi:hypothetical protein